MNYLGIELPMESLKFDKELIEGIIVARPNRFLMKVVIDNKIEYCHCPVTSRIADLAFDNVPCLLSKEDNLDRKTTYNVEAISVDGKRTWIGINQININKFVEYFLKVGCMPMLFKEINSIKREVFFEDSKFDFEVNNCFLEVKSPMASIDAPMLPSITHKEYKSKVSSQRFKKHIVDLTDSLKTNKEAFLLICFQYDRPPFKVKYDTVHLNYLSKEFKDAVKKGVKVYQCNLTFEKDKVSFNKCFDLTSYYLTDYDKVPLSIKNSKTR